MLHLSVFLVSVLQFSFLSGTLANTGCEIDPFSPGAPLLIEKTNFMYPRGGERTIKFQRGHFLELFCPAQNLKRKFLTKWRSKGAIVRASCVNGTILNIGGKKLYWNKIICGKPKSTSRFTGGNCAGNGELAEIGFELNKKRFLKTMEICFNKTSQLALYSHFEMNPAIGIIPRYSIRPPFQEDSSFYHLNGKALGDLYTKIHQRKTINDLLGLEDPLNSTYIKDRNRFLSRGHLSAKEDFVYVAQKNSTFKYINVAPQWQSFNRGNWVQAEIDTRKYSSAKKVGLRVWTGTYGVASLPHNKTEKLIDLYLYTDNGSRAIPVPKLFWKIVYNPVNKTGIVLIGVNNPFLNETDLYQQEICRDVSGSVTWLNWNKDNISRGFSYACTVPDFKTHVTYAPSLDVTGLLK